MKPLYININNEQIQSNDELEVLNYDLDSDFFFYLGEKIAKNCKVENENALITDFNTQDNAEDYQKIIAQWHELKTILFSEECKGEFDFTLPNGYIHWLRYSEKYNSIYERNFSHGEPTIITIDLEELYEDSVEDLQRKILRKLKSYDLFCDIDEIVFNDDVVIRKSPIICNVKEKYEGIGFKAYKKWLDENKQIEDNNILGTGNPKEPINNLLPLYNITLGETTYFEIKERLGLEDYPTTYIPVPGIEFNIGGPFRKSHAYISITLKKIPTEWVCKGIKHELSCKDMTDVFVGLGFKYLPIEDVEYLEVLENESVNELHFATPDNRYSVHVEYKNDRFDFINITDMFDAEYDNEEQETPSCPNCGSDEVDDDGSDYLQYTCNDCGHNWRHDDTVECPECGSDDVENDGTDYLQYECNACGHMWEGCDDDDEEDELNYDHPLSLNDFFPVRGIILNQSTVQDAERQSYLYARIEHDDGRVIAWANNPKYPKPGSSGSMICTNKNGNVFTSIFMSENDVIFPEWSKLGFDWSLSYEDWILLFKRMGFIVIQTKAPRITSGKFLDFLNAGFVTISKDYSLKFELSFCSSGDKGSMKYSQLKLSFVSVYSKDYCWVSRDGRLKTFSNIEDFYREEPKIYL